MALDPEQKRKAMRWWVQQAFKGHGVHPKAAAHIDVNDIGAAIDAIDTWWDAVPSGGASNQASLGAVLPEPFKGKTDGTQKRLMITAHQRAAAGGYR